jgi:hypothetical protein
MCFNTSLKISRRDLTDLFIPVTPGSRSKKFVFYCKWEGKNLSSLLTEEESKALERGRFFFDYSTNTPENPTLESS